uniref:Putative secreted protein n=1 Tax=Anopheles marajoara TaxID=58244 RepID=A0A2M4CDC1_9DIPT
MRVVVLIGMVLQEVQGLCTLVPRKILWWMIETRNLQVIRWRIIGCCGNQHLSVHLVIGIEPKRCCAHVQRRRIVL